MAEEEPARPGAEEAMELSEEEGAAAAAAAAADDDDDYHDEDDDDDDATVSESELEGEEGGRTKKKGKDKDDAAAGNGKAKAGKKEGQEARKRARQELNDSIARRKEEIINEKKKKLHVRLRYLLAQSDIFSTHFGLGKAVEDAGVEPPKSADEDEGDLPTTFLLKQPASLQGQLRGYQLEGLNWMINLQEQGINGILADEMGLGKTIQTISVMTYLLDFKNITGPHLVLLPKSTLSNWIQEFKRFSPKLRTLRFHGDKEERQALIREVLMPGVSPEDRSWDVCVTTYEIARMEQTALAQVAWRYLVVDEAHRLKNEASMFSVAVRGFTAQHRLLLTGTPLQNNLRELWALLNFLLPDVFGDADKFGAFFDLDIDDNEKKTSLISQLHKILRPFMLRRLKSDAAKELPPKTETILFTNLSQVQRDVYKGLLMRNLDAVNGGSGTARSSLLNIVMQLRKCCNHPYLFAGVEDRSLDPLGEHVVQSCGKLRLLDKLLARLARDGHRVLLFSQMTRMLDILEDFMRMRGHPYCRIDGDTSYDEREDLIENFNAPGSDKFCFLLSTRAGGLGINLQSADTVVLYDSDWNPQADLQAQDRAHRIGQRRPVRVFRLVTENTIEEKVVERAQQKLKLDAVVVQQGRLAESTRLGKDDLLSALRFGADAVFRSSEGEVTEEDIDAILARGEARTAELSEKLQKADFGDILDFRLDGSGLGAKNFEGVNYGASGGLPLSFLDVGKRERRPVIKNLFDETKGGGGGGAGKQAPKALRLPAKLEMPRLYDWQFVNQERLAAIHEIMWEAYRALREGGGELPDSPEELEALLLSPELRREKEDLMNSGFRSWNRSHVRRFVDGCVAHGRRGYDKVAQYVGKSEEEVRAYASTFWSLGPSALKPEHWERYSKEIERGERKREEVQRFSCAAGRLVSAVPNPWETLELKHSTTVGVGRQFTAADDRVLLCLAARYGWGEWQKVKEAALRTQRLAFDHHFKALPVEAIGKRCEHLMRNAEKELLEMAQRKSKRKGGPEVPDEDPARAKERQERLQSADAEMQALVSRMQSMQNTKGQLERLLQAASGDGIVENLMLLDLTKLEKEAPPDSWEASAKKKKKRPSLEEGDLEEEETAAEEKGPRWGTGVPKSVPIPDAHLPLLCRLVEEAGSDGMATIVEKFRKDHPYYSKNMTTKRIKEVGVKEVRKRPAERQGEGEREGEGPAAEDADGDQPLSPEGGVNPPSAKKSKKAPLRDEEKLRWHVRDEFLQYLSMPALQGILPEEAAATLASKLAAPRPFVSRQPMPSELGRPTPAEKSKAKPKTLERMPVWALTNKASSGGLSLVPHAQAHRPCPPSAESGDATEEGRKQEQQPIVSGFVTYCKKRKSFFKSSQGLGMDKRALLAQLELEWRALTPQQRSDYERRAQMEHWGGR